METVACFFSAGGGGQEACMCHQVCPEAVGAKVTPGTLTCVSQSAFQLGNKLMFIAVVLLKQRLKT